MPQRTLTFTQLKIRRIIAHSVLEKDYDAGHSAFELTNEPIIINDEMQATLLQRLEAVMGRRRGGFYLDVSYTGDGTFFNYAINAIAATEEQFVRQSQEIAQLLARSQRRNTIPDSYLLVIDAYDNTSMNQPVFIVVKAEPHKAFRRAENGIELIDNLFLSPGQALYKVGVLYRDEKPSGEASYPNDLYSAFVYDQQAESSDLSKYFYETFLGFTVSRNSALQCKDFFRRTTEFIKLHIASGSMKAKIHQALRHEFAKEALVIKPQEFANENFPEGQLRTLYITEVANKCNPTIHKDLSLVGNLLKKITYKVGDVNISADSSDYANGVTIIENAEQLADLEFKFGYTIIVVKGRVQNAE